MLNEAYIGFQHDWLIFMAMYIYCFPLKRKILLSPPILFFFFAILLQIQLFSEIFFLISSLLFIRSLCCLFAQKSNQGWYQFMSYTFPYSHIRVLFYLSFASNPFKQLLHLAKLTLILVLVTWWGKSSYAFDRREKVVITTSLLLSNNFAITWYSRLSNEVNAIL